MFCSSAQNDPEIPLLLAPFDNLNLPQNATAHLDIAH